MEEPLVWALLRKVEAHDLPSPEVMLDAYGDLCFDWADAHRSIEISLSPTGRVCWAALVGDYKASGTFQWPEWSPGLDKAFVMFNG